MKRHPKKCKFFFSRSLVCKFKSECKFSHEIDLEDKELESVRLEIEKLCKENKVIQTENHELKKKIEKMQEEMKNIKKEVTVQEKERSKLKKENHDIKEINENLMEDLTVLNDKMAHIIPGNLEMEIEELKESNSILKTILMYKEEEIRNEENYTIDSEAEKDEETPPTDVTNFACDKCDFTSTSKKGLNVHTTAKHKKPSPYR